jgi:hypothetical protein
MLQTVNYQIQRNPQKYFQKSPSIFSHPFERFEEICLNGSQKVLWTMLNNLSRDWYYKGCQDFGMIAKTIQVNYFPHPKFTLKGGSITLGDCGFYSTGVFPRRSITRIVVRYSLETLRVNPTAMFFEVIPHEICHALADQFYLNDIKKVGHSSFWQEFMDYFGVATYTGHSEEIYARIEAVSKMETVNQELTAIYAYEKSLLNCS